ncbi:LOW QUALITY PROTEIN: X-box-binding protein 1 [Lampris incognitus]|uniref:LOW QUALITY PROTEIN: X-box-binding protein 1 n=1 Tax=Lampris incognitus TaxID=2546036 RepID=UPI0024B611D6|nr:LOW QUALITY PROTEIN: X-box-binding protein 1 [Lampris incognitus]
MVVVTAGTGGTHKVLLISGKQSGSADAAQGGFSRPISVVLPQVANPASSDSDSNSSATPPLRKRQRLTHLSPEEKALRRKLKNRVAAQTARDRKKAKMGELEQQVLELELENQKLHVENRTLRGKNSGLMTENEELRQRLGLDTLESKEKVLLSGGNDTGLGIGSSESAALRLRVPPQGAGPAVSKPEDFPMDTDSPDSTDNESDLLLGILDILDPELFLKSCESECQEPQVLLVGGGDPISSTPPTALGAAPVKLEALNELILFDHIYTKPVELVHDRQDDNMESVVEVKIEDAASFPATEVEVEAETVCVKDEPEEVVIPDCDNHSRVVDFLSAASSPALGGLDNEAYLADVYRDSGCERSPSPFSNMSSPLCSESFWVDVNELFPQLISV